MAVANANAAQSANRCGEPRRLNISPSINVCRTNAPHATIAHSDETYSVRSRRAAKYMARSAAIGAMVSAVTCAAVGSPAQVR
jgi:hypothetical protein